MSAMTQHPDSIKLTKVLLTARQDLIAAGADPEKATERIARHARRELEPWSWWQVLSALGLVAFVVTVIAVSLWALSR